MERKNGYLIVDDYTFLEEKESLHKVRKLANDGKEFYFKPIDLEMQYKELFYSFLLKDRGLDVVSIDLASYYGTLGIISPSFRNECKNCYPLFQIINKYRKTKEEKICCSIEEAVRAIYLFCIDQNIPYHSKRKELLLKYIMQILLGDYDLHTENIEVLVKEELELSPIYDLEACGEIEMTDDLSKYRFWYLENNNPYASSYIYFLDFLNKGKKEDIELFKAYLEHMELVKLKKVFDAMENQIEKKISEDIKRELNKTYWKPIRQIDYIIEENKQL